MKEKYILTKNADMLAPNWLTDRIDYKTVKFLYGIRDGWLHALNNLIRKEK